MTDPTPPTSTPLDEAWVALMLAMGFDDHIARREPNRAEAEARATLIAAAKAEAVELLDALLSARAVAQAEADTLWREAHPLRKGK